MLRIPSPQSRRLSLRPVGWLVVAVMGGPACSNTDKGVADSAVDEPFVFPDPTDMPELRGGGGPSTTFAAADLLEGCAPLHGSEDKDIKHHNLVVPYRGHLLMPWSPEFGSGGLTLFEMSDPCAPTKWSEGWSQTMRETHAIGLMHLPEGELVDGRSIAGDYAIVTGVRGIETWDISSAGTLTPLVYLELEDVVYPDSYARVVLSVFWQYPWLYVGAADNGVLVLDVRDPYNPVEVTRFDPDIRVAAVYAMGDVLFMSSAEGKESVLYDISVPDDPQPIPGGRFYNGDSSGEAKEAYHAGLVGDMALFARKEGGGGFMVYDVSDVTSPTYVSDYKSDGNGGYVYYDEGFVFVGESSIARIYDARDMSNITLYGELHLPGDFDTLTPYGNVAVGSVDEEAEDDIATMVFPWTEAPDTTSPEVLRIRPLDGATGVSPQVRVGVGFNEFIEPTSVFAGSIQLFDSAGNAVEGWGSGQETIASYCPKEPLTPGETYTVHVMADGIRDINGNAVSTTVASTFTVAGGR
jgi:hypothetical protein